MANTDEETLTALREQRDALIPQLSMASGWKVDGKEVTRAFVAKTLKEVEEMISFYERKVNKTRTLVIRTLGFK